jgi:hypothetical protein
MTMDPIRSSEDQQLDALLRAYAAACPTPEAGANFMPRLWERIESRQKVTFSFRRLAYTLATAALALSIALGVYMSMPRSNLNYTQSYLEALAEANTLDAPDIIGTVGLDASETGR